MVQHLSIYLIHSDPHRLKDSLFTSSTRSQSRWVAGVNVSSILSRISSPLLMQANSLVLHGLGLFECNQNHDIVGDLDAELIETGHADALREVGLPKE